MRNIVFSVFCLILLLLIYKTSVAMAQEEKKKAETPTAEAPKLTLEEHDRLGDLERQSLQVYVQIQTVTKKYQDALNNDPMYQDLTRQNSEIGKKLSDAISDVQKRIDPASKTWVLNPQTLVIDPAPKPEKK